MKVSPGTTPRGWMCACRVGLGCEGVATPQCSPPSQDFDRRVIPVCGLEEVVVDDKTRRALRDIINFEKARSELVLCACVRAYVRMCVCTACVFDGSESYHAFCLYQVCSLWPVGLWQACGGGESRGRGCHWCAIVEATAHHTMYMYVHMYVRMYSMLCT